MTRKTHTFGLLLLILVSVGCGVIMPDLQRLYSMQAGNPDQPPVVVIHGALGSRLANRHDNHEIWPGSLRRILFSDYRSLRMEIDPETLLPKEPTLVTTGIADRAAGRDFYGKILTILEQAGEYSRAERGTPAEHGEKRYYVLSYDWRQDNVKSARELHALIEAIRVDYANPALKVDIVAHSMGGLITRYYARYGTEDVLDDNEFPVNQVGAERIRRVILLGTPNFGSVGALRTLMHGYKIGFGAIPPEVVATFPSTYQVLPHAINKWFLTTAGRALDRDQFSAKEFWRPFQFSVYSPEVRERVRSHYENPAEAEAYLTLLERYFDKHIERARRFSWSLTVPVPDSKLRFILFGSDCHPTPARAVVEEVDGDSVLRLFPKELKNPLPGVDYERLMLEPGDGVVTKASLLARQTVDPTVARHRYSFFPVDYAIFLCETHSQLTGNVNFQNNLLHALLSVDR